MTLSVCPAAEIHTPIDIVWGLLSNPSQYSKWADAETKRIEPEGKAHAGQVIYLKSGALGVKWNVTMKIIDVDEKNHRIMLETYLPLGFMLKNVITCTSMTGESCFVRYG